MIKEINDEEIIKWRLEGKTYNKMVEEYAKRGIQVNPDTIAYRLKRYNIKRPKKNKPINIKPIDRIDEDELIALRDRGMTYEELWNYYKEKGIRVSKDNISRKCKEVYAKRGLQQPKKKGTVSNLIELDPEELIGLRNKKYTYTAMSEYYKKKGIIISREAIRQKLLKVLDNGSMEDSKNTELYEDRIFSLKEQGYSYSGIESVFRAEGIKLSKYRIKKICINLYKSKGKEVPPTIRRLKRKSKLDSFTEKLIEWKEAGFSYERISDELEKIGISASKNIVCRTLNGIYKANGKKVPRAKIKGRPKTDIDVDKIVELRKRGISYLGIREELKKEGIIVSVGLIISRLKSEGIINKGLRRSDYVHLNKQELIEFRKNGMSYKEISDYYNGLGIKVSITTVASRYKEAVEELGEKIVFVHKNQHKRNLVSDQELISLFNAGNSYIQISKILKERGIEVTHETIGKWCKSLSLTRKNNKFEKICETELSQLDEQLNNKLNQKKESRKLLEEYRKLEENKDLIKGEEKNSELFKFN